MTLTRGKKIVLIVLGVLLVWLVAWTVFAAVPFDRDAEVGPVTSHIVGLW